jgi:hypothetical protein
MKPLLLLIFAAGVSAATAAEIYSRDVLGIWRDVSCRPSEGRCRFRNDGVFLWSCGDQVDAGTWRFKRPANVELVLYSYGSPQSVARSSARHFMKIQAFTRHRMVVRLMPDDTKHVLLRWR